MAHVCFLCGICLHSWVYSFMSQVQMYFLNLFGLRGLFRHCWRWKWLVFTHCYFTQFLGKISRFGFGAYSMSRWKLFSHCKFSFFSYAAIDDTQRMLQMGGFGFWFIKGICSTNLLDFLKSSSYIVSSDLGPNLIIVPLHYIAWALRRMVSDIIQHEWAPRRIPFWESSWSINNPLVLCW